MIKKVLLTLIVLIITGYFLSNKTYTSSINTSYKDESFESIIKYIKVHENLNYSVKNIHDDGNKNLTTGYGYLMTSNDKHLTKKSLSEIQADSLLKVDLTRHFYYVKSNFKGLSINQQLAITHMSFCIGIGNISSSISCSGPECIDTIWRIRS